MTELTVFLIPFVIGSMAGAIATLFMTGARRQNAHDDETIALELIADIAEGSTTANSLPHIARIARRAIDGSYPTLRDDDDARKNQGTLDRQALHPPAQRWRPALRRGG